MNEAKRELKEFQNRQLDQDFSLKEELYQLKDKLHRAERARNEAWESLEREKITCDKQMFDLRKVKS